MKLSSIACIEADDVKLVCRLATSVKLEEITNHWGCTSEETIRDGLGTFDTIVLHSDAIGYWAIAGSQAHPEVGATIWAEPDKSGTDLLNEVKRCLSPLMYQIMCEQTGEIVT